MTEGGRLRPTDADTVGGRLRPTGAAVARKRRQRSQCGFAEGKEALAECRRACAPTALPQSVPTDQSMKGEVKFRVIALKFPFELQR